jgi:hypothetical protein
LKKIGIADCLMMFGLLLVVPMILLVAICDQVLYSVSEYINGHQQTR